MFGKKRNQHVRSLLSISLFLQLGSRVFIIKDNRLILNSGHFYVLRERVGHHICMWIYFILICGYCVTLRTSFWLHIC